MLRLPPAGGVSLSLLSTLEVTRLVTIAAQDLHLVRLRLLRRQRRRRRRTALVLAAPAAAGRRVHRTGGVPAFLLRDRTAADEIRRVSALGVHGLGVRPAPQR